MIGGFRSRYENLRMATVAAAVLLGFAALLSCDQLGPGGFVGACLAVVLGGIPRRPQLPARTWIGIQLAFLGWMGWSKRSRSY